MSNLETNHLVQRAIAITTAIENEVAGAATLEHNLDRSYARLGGLLVECKRTEAWQHVYNDGKPVESFAQYLNYLRDKFKRSQGTLWAYTEVAEKLLPICGQEKLDKMGVSKAFELVRASKQSGSPITPALIETALNPETTVKEVRAEAHRTFNMKEGEAPKGTWLDLGGFYADDEERKTFWDGIEVLSRMLELKPGVPQWMKVKECILFAMRECHGTYANEVYGQHEND